MLKTTSVNDRNFIPHLFLTPCLAQALIRDNWRRVATGIVDRRAPERIIAQLDSSTVAIYTQCAHIIPEATYFGVEPKSEEDTKVYGHGCLHNSEELTSRCLARLFRFCNGRSQAVVDKSYAGDGTRAAGRSGRC